MAGERVNTYAQDDSDILALQLTTDKTFKGYHQLTLTEYDTTTVPAIAAGSAIECNGALYKFDTEEAISTTDPVTSATVADGTVYVCIVPGATTATAAFTATAPTWSDSKQGWYGTGDYANYRYAEYKIYKSSTSYSKEKRLTNIVNKFYSLNPSIVRVKLSGDFKLTGGIDTIPLDTIVYDTNSEFNTTTYRFTAKNTGYYHVCFFGNVVHTLTGNIDSVSSYIYINNSPAYGELSMCTGNVESDRFEGHRNLSGSSVIQLNQGDYFHVIIYAKPSGGTLGSYSCYLTIHKI